MSTTRNKDPLIEFINRKKSAMEYSDEDAAREWLGLDRQAFNRRRRNNQFSIIEIRKILRVCHANDEEILKIMKEAK